MDDWWADGLQNIRIVYEAGYGLAIGIVSETTGFFLSGCSVTSRVHARRSGVTVIFSGTGTVSPDRSDVVASKIPSVDAAALANSVAQAGELLNNKAVPLPSPSDVTKGSFTVTSTPPAGASATHTDTKDADNVPQNDESNHDTSMIVCALVGAGVVVIIALGSWHFIRKCKAHEEPKDILVQVHQLHLLLILCLNSCMSSGCNA